MPRRIFLGMEKFTKSEVARQLNVSRQTVYNFIKRGILKPDKDGTITLKNLQNLTAALHDADPAGELYSSWDDLKCQNHEVLTASLHQSAAKLKGNLKDKYITSLEGQIETQQRHIASLEQQVELLQGEAKKLQERCEVLQKESNLRGDFWVNVLREVIRQQPETGEQFEKIIKHFRNIRRQKRTYLIQE
jgi:chromosome segregation ATPase